MESKKDIWIIFASQEFDTANHKYFWEEIALQIAEHGELLILNITADQIVTRLVRKKYRVIDHKSGPVRPFFNSQLFRPMTFIRPEILPKFLHKFALNTIKKQIEQIVPDFNNRKKVILYYDPKLAKSMNVFGTNVYKIYYLYDEVTINASNGNEIPGMKKEDNLSCREANLILTMTKGIAYRRKEFSDKIIIFGNGANLPKQRKYNLHINKSVGFIGNFRGWIDFKLLNKLISEKKDCFFCFAGPIEKNVEDEFHRILRENINTIYLGKIKKEEIDSVYNMVDVVIVPYKDNIHIKSTRPIKVVESVLNKTPVVTIPMEGYTENSFIKIAHNFEEFSNAVDYFLNNKVNFETSEYHDFIMSNSWAAKVKELITYVNNDYIKQ